MQSKDGVIEEKWGGREEKKSARLRSQEVRTHTIAHRRGWGGGTRWDAIVAV